MIITCTPKPFNPTGLWLQWLYLLKEPFSSRTWILLTFIFVLSFYKQNIKMLPVKLQIHEEQLCPSDVLSCPCCSYANLSVTRHWRNSLNFSAGAVSITILGIKWACASKCNRAWIWISALLNLHEDGKEWHKVKMVLSEICCLKTYITCLALCGYKAHKMSDFM